MDIISIFTCSMRGSRIYTKLFIEGNRTATKGRSELLNNRRDECMLERFFFYGKFTDKRYESIVNILSSEFFLSQIRISKVIEANSKFLTALKNEKTPKNYFTKKWPHLNW